MNAFGGSRIEVRPPEKGAFPLDHKGECREKMKVYLDCLKAHESDHSKCRDPAKAYFECRMDRGLMQQEKLEDLGLAGEPVKRDEGAEGCKEAKGFTAGTGARTKKPWLGW